MVEDYKLNWEKNHKEGKHKLQMWWCLLCMSEEPQGMTYDDYQDINPHKNN